MFENLTDRLGSSLKNLAGQGSLTEDNIRDTLREVRKALLEADVALPVVKEFVEQVKEKALGQEVLQSLNPGQVFIKIVMTSWFTPWATPTTAWIWPPSRPRSS